MCLDAVNLCDMDVRRDMYNSVLVVGGGAATKGLKERLDRELQMNAPPSVKLRVVSPATAAERRHSAWLGGSILSSLGSFQQMWMSKVRPVARQALARLMPAAPHDTEMHAYGGLPSTPARNSKRVLLCHKTDTACVVLSICSLARTHG